VAILEAIGRDLITAMRKGQELGYEQAKTELRVWMMPGGK
jgi:hypothetical protein